LKEKPDYLRESRLEIYLSINSFLKLLHVQVLLRVDVVIGKMYCQIIDSYPAQNEPMRVRVVQVENVTQLHGVELKSYQKS